MALYTEDVVTRFKADTKDYEFPIKEATKTTERFNSASAESSQKASKGWEANTASMMMAATGARGLATAIGNLAKGTGDFEGNLSLASFQVGNLGRALGSLGTEAGGTIAKLGGVMQTIGPWGAVIGGAVGIAVDFGKALRGWVHPEELEQLQEMERIVRSLGTVMPKVTQLLRPSEQFGVTEPEVPEWLKPKEVKGKGRGSQGASQRVAAAPVMKITPEEASRAAFEAEWGKPDLELSKQISAAAEASVRASTDFGEARVGLEQWELATTNEANALRELTVAQEQAAAHQKLIAEQTLEGIQDFYANLPGGGFAAMIYGPHKDKNGVIQDLEETSMAGVAMAATVEAAVQGMANATGMAYGRMLGASVRYTYANREQAKAAKAMQLTTGEAMRVMVRDTLKSVAQQSAVKAVMATAEGFAALARYDFGAATNAFTSAGYFAATAALAGAATAAVGSVTKKVPGEAAGKTPSAGLQAGGVGLGAKETQGGPTIINVSMQLLPGTDYARVGEATLQAINLARKEQGKPAIGA